MSFMEGDRSSFCTRTAVGGNGPRAATAPDRNIGGQSPLPPSPPPLLFKNTVPFMCDVTDMGGVDSGVGIIAPCFEVNELFTPEPLLPAYTPY